MTVEQIRKMHGARPFVGFDVHLADSQTLTVHSPEQLAISPSGRTIFVACPDETVETVDLLLVVSIKPRPNGAARGHRRRE